MRRCDWSSFCKDHCTSRSLLTLSPHLYFSASPRRLRQRKQAASPTLLHLAGDYPFGPAQKSAEREWRVGCISGHARASAHLNLLLRPSSVLHSDRSVTAGQPVSHRMSRTLSTDGLGASRSFWTARQQSICLFLCPDAKGVPHGGGWAANQNCHLHKLHEHYLYPAPLLGNRVHHQRGVC